jgi:hypothetical protein
MGESLGDAREVTDPVTVRIGERAHVDLVSDGLVPPVAGVGVVAGGYWVWRTPRRDPPGGGMGPVTVR